MGGITPYVLFPGNGEEALRFYRGVFGGELRLHSYEEFGRSDGPADAIAHGVLSGPVPFSGADAGADEDAVAMGGMFLSLLGSADPEILHGWFDALAVEGRVLEPLVERGWGAFDGQVIDRYGLHWLLGYEFARDEDPGPDARADSGAGADAAE